MVVTIFHTLARCERDRFAAAAATFLIKEGILLRGVVDRNAAIRPRIIHVVTVGAGDTVQSLASRMAYRDFKLDRFITLNGLAPNSRLLPGQKVKLIVYGARRP